MNSTCRHAALLTTLFTVPFLASPSFAGGGDGDWDPTGGSWGKTNPADLRVMTWNIKDNICSTTTKTEGFNAWTALARTVAGLKPDVLMMQEVGDNTGNGTGSGVDSVSELGTTLELFLHGGTDPFNGGTVTSFVQAYDPTYDLPFIYVSSRTDGFNRNVILSRYPFADLNGDTRATYLDTPTIQPDQYATGPNGGIRGFTHVEIDLPDDVYLGDLVTGTNHLKAGGSSSDHNQRVDAAQNIAYYLDYLYGGAGTGTVDPNNKIGDNPPATNILDDNTVIVIGGDWNEDELTNGQKGPAEWLTCALVCGGTDGTDRDGSDMTYDDAREPFSNVRGTFNGGNGSKLDYFGWQDSIATERRSFIFRSEATPLASLPPEVAGFPINPTSVSAVASDHLTVVIDLILPVPSLSSTPFCFGAGCPCGNDTFIAGCRNSSGSGAFLSVSGSASVANDDLVLTAEDFPANNSGLYFMGATTFSGVFVGDGLACTGGLFRFIPTTVSGTGQFTLSSPIAAAPPGQIVAGDTRHFQAWTRDVLCGPPPTPCPSPCGNNSNLSNGQSVTFTP